MKFHLNHRPLKYEFEIKHSDAVFFMGSCFAENMAKKTEDLRFHILKNPNGILFNPLSIANNLTQLIDSHFFDERYILQREGNYYSYLHHSSVHSNQKKTLEEEINRITLASRLFLSKARYLILSFGTAFAYRHKQLDVIVANCHKQPASFFEKVFIEPEQIVESYLNLIASLKTFNPELRILFTVSPIKYLKDGLEANSLSKASLLIAVQRLVKINRQCYYFPAYELLTDDLRDYRFYKEDMAHPNDQAINYIWEKFSASCFSNATQELNMEISKLNSALKHRRLSDSISGQEKLNAYIDEQKERIRKLDPNLNL